MFNNCDAVILLLGRLASSSSSLGSSGVHRFGRNKFHCEHYGRKYPSDHYHKVIGHALIVVTWDILRWIDPTEETRVDMA